MEKRQDALQRINGRNIFLWLMEFMCKNSSSFADLQSAYYAAVVNLEKAGIVDLAEWLNVCEANVTAAVITAAFQGFRNGEIPASDGATTLPAIKEMLTEDLYSHVQTIREYYERLKADGTLIACLAGCLTACALLPWVQPEYTPNVRQVLALALTAEECLGYMPFEESVSELLKTAHPNHP